jgi:hypothetical protein
MAQIQIISEFSENEIVFSAENLKMNYLYGVSLLNPKTGEVLSDEVIDFYVKSATQEVERYLGIHINRTEIEESLDFDIEDYYRKYNPLKVTFPVLKIKEILGRLGDSELMKLPDEWITFSKQVYVNSRNIFMVVNGTNDISFNTTYFINHFGFPLGIGGYRGNTNSIPYILDVIGMLSAIPLLAILGDVRDAGLSSKDLTIDGVRASYSTTSSATTSAYSARILEYGKQLDKKMKELRRHYESIIVESV